MQEMYQKEAKSFSQENEPGGESQALLIDPSKIVDKYLRRAMQKKLNLSFPTNQQLQHLYNINKSIHSIQDKINHGSNRPTPSKIDKTDPYPNLPNLTGNSFVAARNALTSTHSQSSLNNLKEKERRKIQTPERKSKKRNESENLNKSPSVPAMHYSPQRPIEFTYKTNPPREFKPLVIPTLGKLNQIDKFAQTKETTELLNNPSNTSSTSKKFNKCQKFNKMNELNELNELNPLKNREKEDTIEHALENIKSNLQNKKLQTQKSPQKENKQNLERETQKTSFQKFKQTKQCKKEKEKDNQKLSTAKKIHKITNTINNAQKNIQTQNTYVSEPAEGDLDKNYTNYKPNEVLDNNYSFSAPQNNPNKDLITQNTEKFANQVNFGFFVFFCVFFLFFYLKVDFLVFE